MGDSGGTIRHGSSNVSITTATGSSNTSSATNSGSGGVVGRQHRLHQQQKSATAVDLAGYGAGFDDEQMFYRPDCWTARVGAGNGGHLTATSMSSSSGNSSSNKHRRQHVIAAATVSPPQTKVGYGNATGQLTGCQIEYLRADVENNNNGGSANKNGTMSVHQPWLRRTTATTTNKGRTATATAAFVDDVGGGYETSTVGRRTTAFPKSTSCHTLQCAATRSAATLDIAAARHHAANGGNKLDQQQQQRVHLKNIVNNSKTSNGNNNNNINYHHRGYRIGDLVPPPPPPPQVHLYAAAAANTTSRRQTQQQAPPPAVHGVVTVTAAGNGCRPNAVVRTSSYTAAAAAGLAQTATLIGAGERHVDISHVQHHQHHQQQQHQSVVGGLGAGITPGRTIPGKTTVIQASTSELLRWLLIWLLTLFHGYCKS